MFISVLHSCKKADFPGNGQGGKKAEHGFAENNMVLYWNEKASMVLTGSFTPPAQARHFAMMQIAVHDALNAIKPKYERYALKNVRDQFASIDAAVASAAYHTLIKMKVEGSHPVGDWYEESLSLVPNGESKAKGIALGIAAADAIVNARGTDNFLEANKQLPGDDGVVPGAYRSTLPFSNPGALKIKALHQWGTLMKPFVIQSNSQFRPEAPYPVSSAAYVTDYNEVKEKGGRVGHTRTANETEIGVFWLERSSIGWNRFARNMISSRKMDAWKTARVLALMHTAMADGITACFEAKYYYFYWRPETAIRLGDNDGNELTIGDAAWLPSNTEGPNPNNPLANVYTPPIPDYPSAHANFGGAAGEVLRLFFQTDAISVNQASLTMPGVVRKYTTISNAIRENSLSRIYVGYHFRKAVMAGEEQGVEIAHYVFNNAFRESDN